MMVTDYDALLCDFAEYYHIYDLESLPLPTIATLACGLRENARIILKLQDQKISTDIVLKAAIFDKLAFIAWAKTKDAQSGSNRPDSLVMKLLNPDKENEVVAFEDENELLARIAEIKEAHNARYR